MYLTKNLSDVFGGWQTMNSVDEAIGFLAKTDVPKQEESSLAVERIATVASDEGLDHDQITRLVDLATSGKFAESVSARLVKTLIPKTSVPVIAVVKAISRICTNKLTIKFQDLLIRWIVIVYNLIDDVRDLHLLYGIIFLFLESDVLCPHVCHLLYYLTRKEDVKHFRIKKLLDLQNRKGTKPYLSGLLSLYPISMATSAANKKVWFKLSDRPWREAIKKVQKKSNSHSPVDSFYVTLRNTAMTPIAKRRKIIAFGISEVQTAMTPSKRICIGQIFSFKELLDNIDNIEFPSQVASVLNSPFLQHVVSCNPDLVVLQRLNFWLNQSLYEEFLADGSSESDLFGLRLLQKLKQFTSFLQESIPAVEAFLVRYLFSWNGLDYRPLVLQLITYLGLWPFQRLNDLVLEPLRRLFYSTQVYVKCQVMYCFTELLRNFLTVKLPRKRQLQEKEQTDGAPEAPDASVFFEDDMEPFAPLKTIYDFIQFVDRICVVALQAEEDHPLLQHWVLNFFELVSTSHQRFDLPFVLIPSSGIIYRMLFSSNSMAVSRLCSIIVNYKMEFESLKKAQAKTQNVPFGFPDGFQSIQRFNQYILDICDSLWRNKAFVDREKSFCFSIPSSVTDSLFVRHMNESFSIHHHISLVGEAWKFLHQTQPEGIKLTPSLIKGRSRRAYMEFLKGRNLGGILVFLDTFIRPRSQDI